MNKRAESSGNTGHSALFRVWNTGKFFWVLQKKASDSNDESDSNQGGRLLKLCASGGKHEENEIILSSRASPENSNIIMLKYFKVFLKQVISYSS